MTILLFALSVLPSLVLLMYTRKQNNYSYHPTSFIIKLLIFGTLIVIPVYAFEVVIDAALFSTIHNYSIYLFVSAFIGVALVEEFLKFVVLYEMTKRYDKYFKTLYDGIIYSVSVALGFAIIEDIAYVFIYYGGNLSTALLRAAMPGHFCFSIFMGLLFSKAKRYEKYDTRKYSRNLILSLLVPTIIHGLYDYCLMNGNSVFISIFIILIICLYIFAYRTIKNKSKEILFI